jgi:hypothetical protein
LAEWRRELEACFAGRPGHPVFVALAQTARETGLTIEPFAETEGSTGPNWPYWRFPWTLFWARKPA